MKKLLAAWWGAWALATVSITAFAGKQDFVLHNETGVEIHELYVSPSKSDDWEEDILGRDTLPSGESVDISFHRSEKARKWDLKIVDDDGGSVEWENLDLSTISEITLYIKKGEAWAETK